MSSSEDEPELETLNISNDQFYEAPRIKPNQINTKTLITDSENITKPSTERRDGPQFVRFRDEDIPKYGSKTIRHSLAAYDLWRPFFPTYLSEEKFRNFHRPKLRHYNTGPQGRSYRGVTKRFPIKNLTRHIYRSQKQLRLRVLKAIELGASREDIVSKLLLINKTQDLTAKSGELFFFEYCEEYPPVLSQIGMASNVKKLVQPVLSSTGSRNKSRSREFSSNGENERSDNNSQTNESLSNEKCDIGFVDKITKKKNSQVYFSQVKPGESLTVIENNLYRAPIYEHQFSNCDFLLIRTRNSFYIRQLGTIFTVGQTMPLNAIPQPSLARILKFRCDLSNLYINKLFKESDTKPATIRINSLTRMFPDYSANTLKQRLNKNGAYRCRKTGDNNIFEKGTSNYGAFTLLELRKMYYPEHYSLNMATLAARQRLRELNYTETMIDPPGGTEMETEVLAAPWNTSKAICDAAANKVYLDLKQHLIDPSNPSKEGFSCVPWSKSPAYDEQLKQMKQANQSSNNTSISQPVGGQAKQYIEKNPLAHKIQREKIERLSIYQREARFISELQAKSLSSKEAISSDESSDEDSENNLSFEEQCRDLDWLITGNRTASQLEHEKEEEERRRMLAELKPTDGDGNTEQLDPPAGSQNSNSKPSFDAAAIKGKILKITRTYRVEPEGQIQRTEIVREPGVIALYINKMGGQLTNYPATNGCAPDANHSALNTSNHNDPNNSILSTVSDGPLLHSNRNRNRSLSLGPSEMCRADGTRLTISKKVLDCARKFRECRRQSMAQ